MRCSCASSPKCAMASRAAARIVGSESSKELATSEAKAAAPDMEPRVFRAEDRTELLPFFWRAMRHTMAA